LASNPLFDEMHDSEPISMQELLKQ